MRFNERMDTTTKRKGSPLLPWGAGCLALAVLLVVLVAVGGGGRTMADNPLLLLVPLLGIAGLVLLIVGAVRR